MIAVEAPVGGALNANEDEASRARRERWWRSALLIVATMYVTLLLVALVVQILGGFTQILLIVFLAWLLAFVLSPLVAWIVARGWMRRGAAIGVVYAVTLVGSGFLLFYAASSIAASTADLAAEFPLTRARIEGTLRSWESVVTFGALRARPRRAVPGRRGNGDPSGVIGDRRGAVGHAGRARRRWCW